MLSSSSELCLIDAGVTDLTKLTIPQHLRVLNLHANHIERIENIGHACFLVHLDLSSNRIKVVENLASLVRLRTLNLSCNYIQHVSGLSGLVSLASLDLSYNHLEKLDGFVELRGPRYRLRCVNLRGNQIASVNEVSRCLSGCQSLQTIMISDGSSAGGNPLCRDVDFAAKIFTRLPHLVQIDGQDSHGRLVETDSELTDVAGLEAYDEFLSTVASSSPCLPAVTTPNIDAALKAYRRGKVTSSSAPSDIEESTAVSSKSDQHNADNHADRLHVLEQRLSDLVNRYKVSNSKPSARQTVEKSPSDDSGVHRAKCDTDHSDNSDDDKIPTRTSDRTAEVRRNPVAKPRESQKSRGGRNSRRQLQRTARSSKQPEHPAAENQGSKYSASSDRKMRDDLRATYVELVRELEAERERRMAAEQTVNRVTQQLEDVMQKSAEENDSQQTALDAAVHLKRALVAEKESHKKSQAMLKVVCTGC